MLKLYIRDIFTEGLGDIFFMKYYKFLRDKIKNKFLYKILLFIHIVFYLLFLSLVIFILFKINYPL